MNLNNLFELTTLTAAVAKLPAVPSKLGAMGLFEERGVSTTTVVIDQSEGRLSLIPNTSRNAEAHTSRAAGRTRRVFETLHLPACAQILPSELQNIAAFGQGETAVSAATIINDRLQQLKNHIEATREWQRVGAVRGQILDADGSVIYDLFREFGVQKHSIELALSADGTDVRKHLLDAKRHAERKLGGVLVQGWRAVCGSEFFDRLTGHKKVQAAFANWQEAADRLGGDMRRGFRFGDIEFMEYDAHVGGQAFIPSDVAQLFPVARGVFQMVHAPANYNETANTVGLPFYARALERRMGKGWDVEVQSNPLALCLFPEALVEIRAV